MGSRSMAEPGRRAGRRQVAFSAAQLGVLGPWSSDRLVRRAQSIADAGFGEDVPRALRLLFDLLA